MVVSRCDIGRQQPKGIEGRFLAFLELLSMFSESYASAHGRAFDHDLHIVVPGDLGQLAEVSNSANWPRRWRRQSNRAAEPSPRLKATS